MSTNSTDEGLLTGRRLFLRQVATLAGSASLAPKVIGAAAVAAGSAIAAPASAQPAGAPIASAPAFGYESLGPDEASFVEAMVNVMCPADNLTPNGVDCGLAVFIDRQLAGGFGTGDRLYMRGPWKQGQPMQSVEAGLTKTSISWSPPMRMLSYATWPAARSVTYAFLLANGSTNSSTHCSRRPVLPIRCMAAITARCFGR